MQRLKPTGFSSGKLTREKYDTPVVIAAAAAVGAICRRSQIQVTVIHRSRMEDASLDVWWI